MRSRPPIPVDPTLNDTYEWAPKPRVFDVYRDPIPVESCGKLRTVLSNLGTRVRQLLDMWPGQPSLVRVSRMFFPRFLSDQIISSCTI